MAPIPKVERGDLMGAFYRRLTGDNKEVRQGGQEDQGGQVGQRGQIGQGGQVGQEIK